MRYIQGRSRHQATLLPEVLDDFIGKNHAARFIDAFVDELDFADLGFTHGKTKSTGRKPYSPGDLLKLYIYGHLNQIRSSRLLEKATRQNVEVMWLLGRLTPDFKTIADFRKDNGDALKGTLGKFVVMCKKLNLFGNTLVAIDGSKFKASNHNSRNYTQGKIKKLIKSIDKKIDNYLKTMDLADKKEDENTEAPLSASELQNKIKELRERKNELSEMDQSMRDSGETQVSLTDKDSRKMRASTGKSDMCYNVQIVTDSKHKLIVCAEVTNDVNDMNQLSNMAVKAKETLGADSIQAVADAGYFNSPELKKCHYKNIKCFVPRPNRSQNRAKGFFAKADFKYMKDGDYYVCPAGQKLIFRGLRKMKNMTVKRYQTSDCKTCKIREKCTASKRYNRQIERCIDEDIADAADKRAKKNPKIMALRQQMVEHPFGTLKLWMGDRHFLTRGFKKVSGEFALAALTYNIRRAINIFGVKELVKMVA